MEIFYLQFKDIKLYDFIIKKAQMTFIPVIHTKDEQGNAIDKICARGFWKGRDSYRKLQNDFHKYVTSI